MKDHNHKGIGLPSQILMAAVSGLLVPLSFPPYGCWPLILVSCTILLRAVTDTTSRRAFYLGLFQGMVGSGTALCWLFNIFSTGAVALHAILAFFTALFCLGACLITKDTPKAPLRLLLIASLWTALEYYRSEWFFLRFPWVTVGSAFGPTYLSPIVGVYGVSFLAIMASAGLITRRTIPFGILLGAILIAMGLLPPKAISTPTGESITVTAVQSEDCELSACLSLTASAPLDSNPNLIVWPEYALPYDVRRNPDDMVSLTNLVAERNATLVLGTKTETGSGETWKWRNTALTLDSTGVIGEYYKARPVHFFDDGIPGTEFNTVSSPIGIFGTPICFDCDYTEVMRKLTTRGATFFAVPSFDAKKWSANQHLQHSMLFRLRAAENGRWIVCAASSGVSQIIDPHGNVHESLPPMEDGAITGQIGKRTELTFFTRVGWLFPWLTVACSIVMGLLMIRARFTRQSSP